MKKLVLYIHGKGGNAAEGEHYAPLFPDCDVVGLDYRAETPWEAVAEFPARLAEMRRGYDDVTLIANSIGAFFAMSALSGAEMESAYFISPVVDMERLITDMMTWANVKERELKEKKQVETPFGETLSWDYLCYVRDHPIRWAIPTHILFGEKDHLTSYETISAFAEGIGASLTVMKDGEHWFHTPEQMAFLDEWIKNSR